MTIQLIVNGKIIYADVDDTAMKNALKEKKKKPTGYEVPEDRADAAWYEKYPYENGLMMCKINCFYSDAHVAADNARADLLMTNLRKFAAEHGGAACPWDDNGFALYWDHLTKQVKFRLACQEQVLAGAVRFKNEDAASGAIEKFKVELEWYFTEYDPMPKGWWDD